MKKIKCITAGGNDNANKARKDILEFNHMTESWTAIGEMKEPKGASVSVVSFDDYEKWCTN